MVFATMPTIVRYMEKWTKVDCFSAKDIYLHRCSRCLYIYIYTPFSQGYTDGAHRVELKLIDVSLGASAILFTLYSGDPVGD